MEERPSREKGQDGSSDPAADFQYLFGKPRVERRGSVGPEVVNEDDGAALLTSKQRLSPSSRDNTGVTPQRRTSKSSHVHLKCLLSALHLLLFLESFIVGIYPVVCQSQSFNEGGEMS